MVVFGIEINSMNEGILHEHLHNLDMAPSNGHMKSCLAIIVLGIEINVQFC